ncbi:ankyrin repeat-containing protein, putative [Metarhizium acridum CQMa 102]|uniref:Ankyrin repeat-containing protein, putative n=1 Tax=Metarhizium acridum (strain CQMa 102) TaxID=655827 RepID=E9EIS9_METAQ|nr:ankyrin repeat-containing protein, putative [Metarhizium acridum CQMa 102]EFY84180.1 ankyrin repeat-containing protein, putative [Metarhizium acridum CQMa 102]
MADRISSVLELEDVCRRTPLSYAAERGDIDAVSGLLNKAANYRAVDALGRTPIFWAAIEGHVDVIKELIAYGAEWKIEDASGRTPLSCAAEKGHTDAACELVTAEAPEGSSEDEDDDAAEGSEKCSDNDSDDFSMASTASIVLPLNLAVRRADEAAVKTLLQHGMDMYYDSAWEEDPQPVLLAAKTGNGEIMDMLLKAGLSLDRAEDMYGRTALMFAAVRGHESTVQILLARPDIQLDSQDETGKNALTYAIEGGHENIAQMLRQAGLSEERGEAQSETSSAPSDNDDALIDTHVPVDSCHALAKSSMTQGTKDEEVVLRQQDERVFKAIDSGKQDALSLAIQRNDVHAAHTLARHKGIDGTALDNEGMSPLLWSVKSNMPSVTRMLMATTHALHVDNQGRSLIHHAAMAENGDIFPFLVKMGVPVDGPDKSGRTPLSYAAELDRVAIVKLLLQNTAVDVNHADKTGRTPLSYAAEGGSDQTIELLLERPGVKATLAAENGRTPLSYACTHSTSTAPTFELLSAVDASVADTEDKDGRTPISWAAGSGSASVCSRLISLGVDVDRMDKNKRSPLSLAAERPYADVVRVLLGTQRVDRMSKCAAGRTPLDWAVRECSELDEPCLDWHRHQERKWATAYMLITGELDQAPTASSIERLLKEAIERGKPQVVSELIPSPLAKDIYSPSELIEHAMEQGSDEMVRAVVTAFAKSEIELSPTSILSNAASAGRTVLVEELLGRETASKADDQSVISQAAANGHIETIQMLLEKGTDVNQADVDGKTPLMLAGIHDQEETIKVLLESPGINVNAVDKDGRTAVSHVAGAWYSGCLKLLLADPRVDAKRQDSQGRSPLWYAVAAWRRKAIRALLEAASCCEVEEEECGRLTYPTCQETYSPAA